MLGKKINKYDINEMYIKNAVGQKCPAAIALQSYEVVVKHL